MNLVRSSNTNSFLFFFFSNKRTSLRQSSSLFVINFQLFPSISLLTINPPFLRRPHIIPRFFLLDKTTCLKTINVHTVHTIVVIRNFTQKLVLHRYLSRSFFQQNGQREWERSKKERKKRKRDEETGGGTSVGVIQSGPRAFEREDEWRARQKALSARGEFTDSWMVNNIAQEDQEGGPNGKGQKYSRVCVYMCTCGYMFTLSLSLSFFLSC